MISMKTVDSADEFAAVCKFLADGGLPSWPTNAREAYIRQQLAADPRPKTTIAAFDGDRLVGATLCAARELNAGPETLPVAVLHAVFVDADRRSQGLGRDLVAASVAAVAKAGAGLLILGYIPGFTTALGAQIMHQPTWLSVEKTAACQRPPREDRVRMIQRGDAPLLAAWYGEHRAGYLGAPQRTAADLDYQLLRRETEHAPYWAIDDDGQPAGYLALPPHGWGQLAVDAFAPTPAAALDLLAAHVRRGLTWASEPRIHWPIPLGDPTVSALAAVLPVTLHAPLDNPDAADAVATWAIVASPAIVCAKLQPLLSERVHRDVQLTPTGTQVVVVAGEERATLSPEQIVQLTFCAKSPAACGLTAPIWSQLWPIVPTWMPPTDSL